MNSVLEAKMKSKEVAEEKEEEKCNCSSTEYCLRYLQQRDRGWGRGFFGLVSGRSERTLTDV